MSRQRQQNDDYAQQHHDKAVQLVAKRLTDALRDEQIGGKYIAGADDAHRAVTDRKQLRRGVEETQYRQRKSPYKEHTRKYDRRGVKQVVSL